MGCGIYRIINKTNNKIYIGSSVNILSRFSKHKSLLKHNKHDNDYLQNSYNKYGLENFLFEIIEFCEVDKLIDKENHYIEFYKSNDLNIGYNLATVNKFRRNNYNKEVKIKNSKFNLIKNGNFTKFKSINLTTNEEIIFDSLVDAADYLFTNNFSKGKLSNIRQKLSYCLRGKKVNNGSNGSIRKTAYNHLWVIIK
jgi:group I intron endonuclease